MSSNLFKWDSGQVASGGSELPVTDAENDVMVGDGLGAWIKKTLAETRTILGVADDGWLPGGTWAYSSAGVFSVSGDLTSRYQVGTKIKLTQTTVKYFYVVSSIYSAPNTLVTITAGNVYTLANAAISANFYSQACTPEGFPDWFDYTPTIAGTTSNTITLAHFSMVGRTVNLGFVISGTGTGTEYYITLPVETTLIATVGHEGLLGLAQDNGTFKTTPCRMAMASYGEGGCYLRFFSDMVAGNWTTSGARLARGFMTYYVR